MRFLILLLILSVSASAQTPFPQARLASIEADIYDPLNYFALAHWYDSVAYKHDILADYSRGGQLADSSFYYAQKVFDLLDEKTVRKNQDAFLAFVPSVLPGQARESVSYQQLRKRLHRQMQLALMYRNRARPVNETYNKLLSNYFEACSLYTAFAEKYLDKAAVLANEELATEQLEELAEAGRVAAKAQAQLMNMSDTSVFRQNIGSFISRSITDYPGEAANKPVIDNTHRLLWLYEQLANDFLADIAREVRPLKQALAKAHNKLVDDFNREALPATPAIDKPVRLPEEQLGAIATIDPKNIYAPLLNYQAEKLELLRLQKLNALPAAATSASNWVNFTQKVRLLSLQLDNMEADFTETVRSRYKRFLSAEYPDWSKWLTDERQALKQMAGSTPDWHLPQLLATSPFRGIDGTFTLLLPQASTFFAQNKIDTTAEAGTAWLNNIQLADSIQAANWLANEPMPVEQLLWNENYLFALSKTTAGHQLQVFTDVLLATHQLPKADTLIASASEEELLMYTQTDSVAQLHVLSFNEGNEMGDLFASDTIRATGAFAGMSSRASGEFIVAFQRGTHLDLYSLNTTEKPKLHNSFDIQGKLLATKGDYLLFAADTAVIEGVTHHESQQNKVLLLLNKLADKASYTKLEHPYTVNFEAFAVRGSEIYVLTRQQAGNRAVIFGTDNTFSRINKWGE